MGGVEMHGVGEESASAAHGGINEPSTRVAPFFLLLFYFKIPKTTPRVLVSFFGQHYY